MGKQGEMYEVVMDGEGPNVIFGIQVSGNAHMFHISSDRHEVEKLARRFNEYELSPVHFSDAVQDYLKRWLNEKVSSAEEQWV